MEKCYQGTQKSDLEIANLKAKEMITRQTKGGKEKSTFDYVILNKIITNKVIKVISNEEKKILI